MPDFLDDPETPEGRAIASRHAAQPVTGSGNWVGPEEMAIIVPQIQFLPFD